MVVKIHQMFEKSVLDELQSVGNFIFYFSGDKKLINKNAKRMMKRRQNHIVIECYGN